MARTENEAIISDDQKVAETLSNFSVSAVYKLDIKEFKNISNIEGLSDPLEIAIKKYENHPSIIVLLPLLQSLILVCALNLKK